MWGLTNQGPAGYIPGVRPPAAVSATNEGLLWDRRRGQLAIARCEMRTPGAPYLHCPPVLSAAETCRCPGYAGHLVGASALCCGPALHTRRFVLCLRTE
jgi:hypothetical protein